MRRIINISLLFYSPLMFLNIAFGQNLINNPSFEEHTHCPTDVTRGGEQSEIIDWSFYGTPDYYNSCSPPNKGVWVPKNGAGYRYAHSGNAYVGASLYSKGYQREYVYTKLKSPLVKEKKYYIRIYTTLAEGASAVAISNIQVLLTNAVPAIDLLESGKAQLSNSIHNLIIDTLDWVELSWIYKAKGGEDYLTIGNFDMDNYTRAMNIKKGSEAYYFFDDVCVSELKEDGTCNCEDSTGVVIAEEDTAKNRKLSIDVNKNIALNNVFFESGKSRLLATSYKELDQLVSYLKTNQSSKIVITGFTDNIGTENQNKTLSTERAESVSRYLESKGIKKARISCHGYGSAQPRANNNTKEGNARNRRVEFIITK